MLRGSSIKFCLSDEYRSRAEHCLQQSSFAKDVQIKRYWDELAVEWQVLENIQVELGACRIVSDVKQMAANPTEPGFLCS